MTKVGIAAKQIVSWIELYQMQGVRPQLDVAITITLKQISCTFSGYI